MNRYLEKIAEAVEKGTGPKGKWEKKASDQGSQGYSWIVPSIAATLPIAGYGTAKHHDLGIQLYHASIGEPKKVARLMDQIHANKKVSAGLAATAALTTGVAEVSRRKYLANQNKEQANKLTRKIEEIVEKQASEEPKHDWKPALQQGAVDMATGGIIGHFGNQLATKHFGGKVGPVIGAMEGAASFAMADHLQRQREKKPSLELTHQQQTPPAQPPQG